ncbi:MAG: HAMP domain-containing sensor histidine kinase [Muribaculaceae bacterium]|nr:HAMP domain-containing sensor histidine kinase [Muribaculaceae bacterium]
MLISVPNIIGAKSTTSLESRIGGLLEMHNPKEFEKAWRECNKLVSHTDEAKDLKYQLNWQKIMFYYHINMNADTVAKYAPLVQEYLLENKRYKDYYYIWGVLGDAYTSVGKISKAINEGRKMQKDANMRKNKEGAAYSAYTIAMAYYNCQDATNANIYFNKVIPLLTETKNWSLYVVAAGNYIGSLLVDKNIKEAEKIFIKLDNLIEKSQTDTTIVLPGALYPIVRGILASQIYWEKKDVKMIVKYMKIMNKFYQDNPGYSRVAMYKLKQRYANLTNNYAEEDRYIDSLLVEFDGDMSNEYKLYDARSKLYESMGNYKGALKMLQKHNVLYDSINNATSKSQLAQFSAEYDLNQLEFEKIELDIQLKNKVLMIYAIVITALVILLIIVAIFIKYLLKANKRIKLALKVKDTFIHHISHEVRTPLNYLVGFSDIIAEQVAEDESVKMMAKEMAKGKTELIKMFDDIVLLSELEDESFKLKVETIDLNKMVEDIKQEVMPLIPEDVNFICNIDEDLLQVTTSRNLVKCVIFQLLHNSFKFTSTGSVTLEITKSNNSLSIIVTDTGIGIPQSDFETIFDDFKKVDEFTQGLGIGLYISKIIASKLKGTIWLDSTYHKGTKFFVNIPLYNSQID